MEVGQEVGTDNDLDVRGMNDDLTRENVDCGTGGTDRRTRCPVVRPSSSGQQLLDRSPKHLKQTPGGVGPLQPDRNRPAVCDGQR